MYWLQVMAAERRVPMSVTMARSQSEGETKDGTMVHSGGQPGQELGRISRTFFFSQSQAAIANGRGLATQPGTLPR